MKTISKYRYKQYKCAHCEWKHMIGTNHFGETYGRCPNFQCISNRPITNVTKEAQRHICLEELPEGMGRPQPWTVVKLGDIVEIIEGE